MAIFAEQGIDYMLEMAIWILTLCGSLSIACVAVAFDAVKLHLIATSLISLAIVAKAVSDHSAAAAVNATRGHLAALTSRYMGLMWAWSGVSAYIVYGFVLSWTYWLPTVTAMLVFCVAFLFLALIMDRDDAAKTSDTTGGLIVAALVKGQFVVSAVLLGGILSLFSQSHLTLGKEQWVALNLFLCAAATMVTLTGYLLIADRVPRPDAVATGPAA